jgi:hypothetical protein
MYIFMFNSTRTMSGHASSNDICFESWRSFPSVHSIQDNTDVSGSQSRQHRGQVLISLAIRVVSIVTKIYLFWRIKVPTSLFIAYKLVVISLEITVVSTVAKRLCPWQSEWSTSSPKNVCFEGSMCLCSCHSLQIIGDVPENQTSQHRGQAVISLAIRVANTVTKHVFCGPKVITFLFIAYSLVVMSLAIRVVSTVAR